MSPFMNRIALPYGESCIETDVTGYASVQILEQKAYMPECSEYDEVSRALSNPIGSPTLRTLAFDKDRVLVITNDMTRPMPSVITIPALIHEIKTGNPNADITILVASGLHRKMTRQELIDKMGESIVKDYRVIVHDAYKKDDLAFFGELSTGNPLWLNNALLNTDLVIAEGYIETHWLAGFSGGRKSVMPGIAGVETVMNNHCPEYIDDPATFPGNMNGNRAHAEFVEAAEKAGLAFILNVALNSNKKIIKAYAGNPFAAHIKGCEFVADLMTVPCKASDIVVVTNGGYPLDINMYQACKGLITASRAAHKDSVIILCAQCREGLGHKGFADVMNMKMPPEELLKRLHSGDIRIHDQWGAQAILNVMVKHEIIVVSDMDRTTVENMGLQYAATVSEALNIAKVLTNDNPSINVIPQGPVIIPEIMEGELL